VALVSKGALLDAAKSGSSIQTERLFVPEMGGEVIVRSLTGSERDKFEASLMEQRGSRVTYKPVNVRASLAVRCLVDESGARMFTDDDAEALGELSAAVLGPIYDLAQRLSGMSRKDVDELKKISEAAAGGDSPSPSPSASEA
jgi:hypothetical protein